MSGALMMDKLTEDLRKVTKFTTTTLEGLQQSVPDGDRDALMVVKEHIANVADKDRDVALVVDRTRAIIQYLQEKEGAHVGGGFESSILSAKETWDRVKKQVPITKGQIAPMVKIQAIATRAQIAAFESRIVEYSASVNNCPFWRFNVGVDEARLELDAAAVRQNAMRKECKKMEHTAQVFELQEQVWQ